MQRGFRLRLAPDIMAYPAVRSERGGLDMRLARVCRMSVCASVALYATTLLAASNVSAGAEPERSKVVDQITYGPQKKFSGVYFSNFEASLFYPCDEQGGCEASWLNCSASVCEELNQRAKAMNLNIYGPGGSFKIVFLGRNSEGPTPQKYMQDRPHKVLLEKLMELKAAKPAN
jgi:hypothetical protein